MSAEAVDRLAELAVRFGANVQRGQIVAIGTEPGKEELTRALAVARLQGAGRGSSTSRPSTCTSSGRGSCTPRRTPSTSCRTGTASACSRSASSARRASASPARSPPGCSTTSIRRAPAATSCRSSRRPAKVVNERTTNWTAIPCPTPAWAQLVFADLGESEALERLWQEILHVMRLDEDDPVAKWRERADTLVGAAERLTERRFDALHFTGPGTDLTRRAAADVELDGGAVLHRRRDRAHAQPPDRGGLHDARSAARGRHRARRPSRSSSAARSCAACACASRAGRAVEIDADENAGRPAPVRRARPGRLAARRGRARRRRGAHRPARHRLLRHASRRERRVAHRARLGLRVHGRRGRTCERINDSAVHIDFMIGGPGVDVAGIAGDGSSVPVLTDGAWRI